MNDVLKENLSGIQIERRVGLIFSLRKRVKAQKPSPTLDARDGYRYRSSTDDAGPQL